MTCQSTREEHSGSQAIFKEEEVKEQLIILLAPWAPGLRLSGGVSDPYLGERSQSPPLPSPKLCLRRGRSFNWSAVPSCGRNQDCSRPNGPAALRDQTSRLTER